VQATCRACHGQLIHRVAGIGLVAQDDDLRNWLASSQEEAPDRDGARR
jgi:hypothetical protein